MTDIPTEYEWLSPWLPIEDMPRYDEMPHFGFVLKGISGEPVEASLEDELRRELPPGHVLEGCDLAAVAFCTEDPNDFLFLTDDKNRPIACVHLTWAVETNPMWPRTHVYQSLDDWTKQMHKEHKAAKQSPPAVTEAFCDLRNTVWGAAVVAMIPALVLFCFSRVSGEALELIGFINDTSVTHVLGAVVYSIAVALLALIAGVLCHLQHRTGRWLAAIAGLLSLPLFPLGTLFGVGVLVKPVKLHHACEDTGKAL